jgi:hypothetical protein
MVLVPETTFTVTGASIGASWRRTTPGSCTAPGAARRGGRAMARLEAVSRLTASFTVPGTSDDIARRVP